jgi:WD40 repeat protein
MAQLKESPAASYPQRNAALTALRSLSGRDLGTSTQAWQKYAADLPLTEGPGKNEEPKDKDEIKLALADKKPQPKDVMVASPDASRFARSNNSTIQILGQNKKTVVATFEAPGRVTALAFAPDGKVLFSTGADKNLTAWSASTGQQIFRVGLGDVPTKLAVSVDGKTVNCTGATFFVEVDASSGKLIRKGTIGR